MLTDVLTTCAEAIIRVKILLSPSSVYIVYMRGGRGVQQSQSAFVAACLLSARRFVGKSLSYAAGSFLQRFSGFGSRLVNQLSSVSLCSLSVECVKHVAESQSMSCPVFLWCSAMLLVGSPLSVAP